MYDNDDNHDIIEAERPDPNELGLEVRRQGQGRAKKDLVFDPVTGEFVLGDDGVRGTGDIVTQMTEDGFASHMLPRGQAYLINTQKGN